MVNSVITLTSLVRLNEIEQRLVDDSSQEESSIEEEERNQESFI